MANAFRVSNSTLIAKHRENIAASLSHRLEVARANHNSQLIALLEQEQRQLGLDQMGINTLPPLLNWFRQIWQEWENAIAKSSQLSVDRISDEFGGVLWRAYDPGTGKTLYADSRAEVVKWIEDNGLGK